MGSQAYRTYWTSFQTKHPNVNVSFATPSTSERTQDPGQQRYPSSTILRHSPSISRPQNASIFSPPPTSAPPTFNQQQLEFHVRLPPHPLPLSPISPSPLKNKHLTLIGESIRPIKDNQEVQESTRSGQVLEVLKSSAVIISGGYVPVRADVDCSYVVLGSSVHNRTVVRALVPT